MKPQALAILPLMVIMSIQVLIVMSYLFIVMVLTICSGMISLLSQALDGSLV